MSKRSVEEELRDRAYRLKLNVLGERVKNERNRRDNDQYSERNQFTVPYSVELGDYEKEWQIQQYNSEINAAKQKYDILKEKLKSQQREKPISLPNNRNTSTEKSEVPDRFNQYLELIVQQTQTQNILMNQMLLKNQEEKPSPPVVNPVYNYSPVYPPAYPPIYPEIKTPKPNDDDFQNTPLPIMPKENKDKKSDYLPRYVQYFHTFPGKEDQQTLRQLGLAALFCSILDSNYENNPFMLTDKFLFELKIKEVMTSIQNIYLKSDGEVYSILQSIISNDMLKYELLPAEHDNTVKENEKKRLENEKKKKKKKDKKNKTEEEDDPIIYETGPVEKEMSSVLENLVSKISEIMPAYGNLGFEGKSLLSEMIQTNQTFPNKYFLVREMDLIQIDSTNTVRNVGVLESQTILIGLFYLRVLIMRIMLKPVECGLTINLSKTGENNLRILSSILVKIYRMILTGYISQRKPNMEESPTELIGNFEEINESLLRDAELDPFVISIQPVVDNCKNLILSWANIYAAKLKPV